MKILTSFFFMLIASTSVIAQDPSDWAKQAQNPMADLMSLPIENHFNAGVGHKDGLEYVLNLKPSMPSRLSEGWIMINRLDIPLIYQPGLVSGERDSHGLGDITYESFYGPSGKRNVYWGIGPLVQIPSSTDNSLGSQKWSAGLGGVGLVERDSWLVGLRANHLCSFAGGGNHPDVDLSTFEYFAYYNFGQGWSIGTSPINTANWGAAQNETWTVPIGGGIGKVVMSGRMPINFKLEAYHYVEAPANTADWSLLFEIQFLLPEEALFKK